MLPLGIPIRLSGTLRCAPWPERTKIILYFTEDVRSRPPDCIAQNALMWHWHLLQCKLHLWAPIYISFFTYEHPNLYNQHSHQHSQTNSSTDPQRVSSRGKWCKRTIPVFTKHIITCTTTRKSCSCQFQLYDDTIYCEAMSAIHDLRTHFDNYGASMDFHFLVASCEDCRLLPFWGAWLAKKWHWFTSFVDIYHCLQIYSN